MLHRFCCFGSLFLCILLLLSLLTGCTDTGDSGRIPKPESLTSNKNDTVFTSLPEKGRGYGTALLDINGDWKEDPNTSNYIFSLTYTGEAVSFVYQLCAENNDPAGEQMGVRLYLDGVPQPFTVGEAEGIAPCDQPVEEYYFDAYRSKTYCIPITLTPVCGYTGDSLPLFVMFTPSPNYKVTKIEECAKGGWMKSTAATCYPLIMEADAPEQKTVDVQQIDTGVQNEGEDGRFSLPPVVTNRGREALKDAYKDEDKDKYHEAFIKAGYSNSYGVTVLKLEEGHILNIILKGLTACTPRYRFQLRLDGKPVPLFDGKYYADARLPNTKKTGTEILISLDFDLTEYPEARTAQLLMIPLPEGEYTWREYVSRFCQIHTPIAAWIRYDGDEIE